MCFVEINVLYSQREVVKRVQNNINQLNFADIEEVDRTPS